ncbi:FMN-dependent NADH-azoreductase [Pelagirhabdus alkalitolerans]|uniref:FMN dependent NADH:quinone oxidoreductase n=1 Tax=Pelagirhabdus alkalitolerans TaxID=1612202 RepID=A0A1G6IL87_9BACI|nr:FMN-dependent NADH-azoreductase [Pelagirhabdus alkalitolerans]SDC07180.1 FMN-dependent NADH-azoreductase [Pelagirhabdus alkalitolerans]
MTKLLVVKANNRPSDQAITSKMYDTFMEEINQFDNLTVKTYDVYEEDTPFLGQELFSAFTKIEAHEALTDTEQRLINAKQKAMDLFEEADVIAFAFPLWNLTIPAKLQTFIDYIFSAGFTFNYAEDGGMIQLMPEKKIILLNARGGVYSTSDMSPMEMAVNYMKTTFGGVFGMDMIGEVIIEGHNADPSQAETIIQKGLEDVKKVAQTLQH